MISLLISEVRDNVRPKKISNTLTYDIFRLLLVARMMNERIKAKINIEIAKMKYTKETDVEEYKKRMMILLKTKTPGAKKEMICEWIIDKLQTWAQNELRYFWS